ncbi:cysteine-rich venom protein ENH1-like, partial [Clarias magur]
MKHLCVCDMVVNPMCKPLLRDRCPIISSRSSLPCYLLEIIVLLFRHRVLIAIQIAILLITYLYSKVRHVPEGLTQSEDEEQGKLSGPFEMNHFKSATENESYQMGENLFKSSELVPWTDVVTAWHNEVANYNYPTGSANGKSIGHYTQVIWFSSYQVGCGVAKCGSDYFYDCQYYRAGNYRRVPPYSLGEPCSACPGNCENKLC